uniref:Keratin, type II cytoskeletal 8 n=1 Tax=Pipistrellus kuhlii TaxID=59472 RepID=A0A7J8A8L0_PIPKU|nr:hypothetical protein mPipKuh1_008945 [Pipistrellus kuhlii]
MNEINKCTEMENKCFLIKKDMDEAYMNKVELETCLERLIHKINFYRQLCEEEIHELQSQISDKSVSCPWTTTALWTSMASSLRSSPSTRTPTNCSRLRLRPLSDQAVIIDAEQHGQLAIKDAWSKVAELEAALRNANQHMNLQLREY